MVQVGNAAHTVILKILALLILPHFNIAVIYYLWFQKTVKLRCCKTLLQLNFRVFNFMVSFNHKLLTTMKIT